jgi:hypothetical protein
MVLQLPGRSYHIIGPSDFPHKYRLSSPLVLLNINEMLGITETGRRYDLTAPRLDPSSAVYQSVADYSGAPQVVIWSDSLFSTPQTLLPSLLHPSGPKQLQPALEAIEALRAAPETWAPKLADLLAMLDIDPQDHHRAVGLDEASWRLALSAQLNEVWPRVALHAWLIPEILTMAYSFGGTRKWLNDWLHRSNVRIGIYSTPKALITAGDTGALLALFRRLLIEAFR